MWHYTSKRNASNCNFIMLRSIINCSSFPQGLSWHKRHSLNIFRIAETNPILKITRLVFALRILPPLSLSHPSSSKSLSLIAWRSASFSESVRPVDAGRIIISCRGLLEVVSERRSITMLMLLLSRLTSPRSFLFSASTAPITARTAGFSILSRTAYMRFPVTFLGFLTTPPVCFAQAAIKPLKSSPVLL